MAPLKIPPELKKITPYIRRAEELDVDQTKVESRLVAYYCRQFAVQVGIPNATSDASKACLGTILADLEEESSAMKSFSKDECHAVCGNFANSVFQKADAEDRAASANRGTAKSFYAAAVFYEVISQFEGGQTEEEASKRVYAKWKATEILKAIKEGKMPVPGGYGEILGTDANENASESENAERESEHEEANVQPSPPTEVHGGGMEVDISGSMEMAPLPPPVEAPPPPYQAVDSYSNKNDDLYIPPAPTPEIRPPSISHKKSSIFLPKMLSNDAYADAVELTKFALASLEARDAELSAEYLERALKLINKR